MFKQKVNNFEAKDKIPSIQNPHNTLRPYFHVTDFEIPRDKSDIASQTDPTVRGNITKREYKASSRTIFCVHGFPKTKNSHE